MANRRSTRAATAAAAAEAAAAAAAAPQPAAPRPPAAAAFERKIAKDASHSLFSILVQVRNFVRDDQALAEARYTHVVERVCQYEAEAGVAISPDAITSETKERQSTGFVIAEKANYLRILTCIHTLAECYTDGFHDLTRYDVDSMFSFQVYCTHHEHEVITARSRVKHSQRLRELAEARVVAVDTRRDLLVLEVDKRDLCLWSGTRSRPRQVCTAAHPVIEMAKLGPSEMDRIFLPSWPPQRAKALAWGKVSSCNWPYDAVTGLNVKGYTSKLLEVNGMTVGSGFFGSPNLNVDGHFVGVYHGVLSDNGMGYSISLDDIKDFLKHYRVVSLCCLHVTLATCKAFFATLVLTLN